MRARVIERRNRFGAPAIDHLADPVVDFVERRPPRDLLELSRALQADPMQRVQQALRPVYEGGHIACDFGADDPVGERHRVGAAHFRDAAAVDRDGQAAGVGTVEGANAWVFFEGHRRLPCRNATIDYPCVWIWRLQHPVRAGLAYHLTEMRPRRTLMERMPRDWGDTSSASGFAGEMKTGSCRAASDRCWFDQATFAGTYGDGREAPKSS